MNEPDLSAADAIGPAMLREEAALAYIPDGAAELVSGTAARRHAAVVAGDQQTADRLNEQVVDVFRLVFPKGTGPSVDLERGTITVDGQTFDVESTEALWYAAILIQADGAWMTEREVWHAEPRLSRVRNGVLTGVRLRELHERLPPIVRDRIERSNHRGRRWK